LARTGSHADLFRE